MAVTNKVFVERFNNMENSNNFELLDKYQKHNIPVKIRCIRCNYIFSKTPNDLQAHGCKCSKCDVITSKLIIGFNDLYTKRPDVANMLKNPEEGFKYTTYANHISTFICPQCGKEINKNIKDVSLRGLTCNFCSDGISYPNKFMAHLLDIIGIDFQTEYQIGNNLLRYDFYFIWNKIKYLIEMDGAMSHGEENHSNYSIKEQILRDKEKDQLAINHGYHLIRIDCKYRKIEDRKNYVINSILDSEISTLFNLSDIDFDGIDKQCSQSIIVAIGNSWNQGVCSYVEFEKIYHIKRAGIRRYLKQACNIGVILDNYQDVLKKIRLASNKQLQSSKGHKVQCIETGEIYVSIAEAQRQTGIYNIGNVINGKQKYAGTLNGMKLSWTLVS